MCRARHGEAAPEASRARAARQIPATALEEAASSASPPRPSAHALVFAIQIRGRVWWRLGSGVGGERWEGARGGSDAGWRRWEGATRGGLHSDGEVRFRGGRETGNLLMRLALFVRRFFRAGGGQTHGGADARESRQNFILFR